MWTKELLCILALTIGQVISEEFENENDFPPDDGTIPSATTKKTVTATTKKTVTVATPKNVPNVAMPAAGAACKTKVTFPIKKTGFKHLPWRMDVFGIPVFAQKSWNNAKNKAKFEHVGSILAELLDNNNDGCVDDPNVHRNLLVKAKKATKEGFGKGFKPAVMLLETQQIPEMDKELMTLGYFPKKTMGLLDCEPKYAGLNYGKDGMNDATIEELHHFISADGYVLAYPKIFGIGWGTKSKLNDAMDKARGKKIKKTPLTQAAYPKNASYRYADISCDYQCQAIEYFWWGYLAYSGMGNGITDPANLAEFKNAKKKDLKKNDKLMYALHNGSELKTAKYRVPVLPVDGKYTGCAKCANGGKSYGGK